MAIYSLQMQIFSRSDGSNAAGLAAYRSGERIRDQRSGRTYDHTDRHGVMHKEILLPARFAGAESNWATDRSALWNAAEIAEKRSNARVAREYMVALPAELTHPQRVDVVRGFAQELAERYGFAVDAVIHAPRNFRGSDSRNFHAHLLATTREVTREGLGRKTTLELSDNNRRELGLGGTREELFYVRRRWAEVANTALEAAHVAARIDHRSLAAQGITREPKLRIPRVAYEIERRGGYSFVAERIREDHRARLEPRHEPQRTTPESESPERDRRRASIEDIARQSVETWRQYRRERLQSGEPRDLARESAEQWAQYRREKDKSVERWPTAEESAEQWAQYLRDVDKLGEARAAEIHLQRTPAAGHDRDYDFGP
jgi:ATP-dependent exoDNAse (exonuclease V) alpha subunit